MTSRHNPTEGLFSGSGEMSALVRVHDWSATPLGPLAQWPQSLKTTVSLLLTSRYAMWMGWGSELTFLYNDAYGQATLADKHPWALGKTAREVWAEIWSDLKPRIDRVLLEGEATWDEGLQLFLERSGYSEETYHTFSYSPLAAEDGTIAGLFCVVTEETERILGERRLGLLRDIAAALASVQTIDAVCGAVAACIDARPEDLPFTRLYLFDGEGGSARLVASTGGAGDPGIVAPEVFRSDSEPVRVDLRGRAGQTPRGPWDRPADEALVLPLAQQGQERPAGFLVAGINPYRRLDAGYEGFLRLVAGQIASGLASARAYEEERRRAEALAELDRAKTAFFSNISHEFRTPLTLMLGPLEDALGGDGLTGESLQTVHRNSLRLLKLVNTLLDFARIEAGRVQARFVATDLAASTAELASTFRSAIEKAEMRLLVDCPPLTEPAFVDRDMWEKIVLNLLSNAFKFTLDGAIEVRLREVAGRAVLSVRDTGVGINAEQLPHIFERFHRIEGTRARNHEGTGIGLALVQELAHLHGGDVAVESAPGAGTVFTVSVPLGSAHLPPERIAVAGDASGTTLRPEVYVEEALRWLPGDGAATEASPAADDSRARVLVADDNADMRDYVRNLLAPHYEVLAVADGAEALRAAQRSRPDLVISDVMMPEMDGFALLRALRTDPQTAGVPVLLLSARAGEEARIEGLSAGADDYLVKPFSARELVARVAAHLALARLRRESEYAIRESDARLRIALRNVPLVVFTCDRDLRYTWVANPRDEQFARTLLGRRDDELYPLEEVEGFLSFKEQILATGQSARQEIAHHTQDGTRYFDMTAEPLRDADGAIVGLTAAAFDITDIKRYELDLAQMNLRLQWAMTETHHRVKNNLQIISALIDMEGDTDSDSVPVTELARLGANVRTLSLIHDILTMEAKQGSLQEDLSVQTVLERLLDGLRQTAGGEGLRFSIDDLRLSGRQATALAIATNELVLNALKHRRERIEVAFRVEQDRAHLAVRDDGDGFPDDFDPQRAANTGLELVENIVRWDLDGQCRYQNAPEGGACITITFPSGV